MYVHTFFCAPLAAKQRSEVYYPFNYAFFYRFELISPQQVILYQHKDSNYYKKTLQRQLTYNLIPYYQQPHQYSYTQILLQGVQIKEIHITYTQCASVILFIR